MNAGRLSVTGLAVGGPQTGGDDRRADGGGINDGSSAADGHGGLQTGLDCPAHQDQKIMSLGPAGAGKETRKSESPGRAGAIHYGLVVVVVVVIIERYRRGLFRLIERDLD
jgi:hypothetical protein